ncbi:5140_t:CDS:2 [Acaulospora morrowiae]|uniref:5140_t:CDS:1 n=1 Tax=Acaulospora morrowiae TaxID=94023 RepID=A0A9N9C0B5_9GLOM|nr:5140_t:CDS:2 [Acaulospora morrowiae]
MSKRTFSSIKDNDISRDFFETKIGRNYDNSRIKFLSPRDSKGFCQAFDPITDRTCGLGCRIKSYMTYPVCSKHDKPRFVAGIHAKDYLKSLPICSSLTDESINNLANYFTDRSLDLKRPVEGGIFYVMHRVDIQNYPELYKIGLDIGNEDCDFEVRISQHEQGLCNAVFAEGYVTPAHSDCRLVDGLIKKLLVGSRVDFKCSCNINHIEYYDDTALSIFERVEYWIYNNPTGPITDKIQNLISLSRS